LSTRFRITNVEDTIVLERPEYRDSATGSTYPHALEHSAETGLPNLDLAGDQTWRLLPGQGNMLAHPPVEPLGRPEIESQIVATRAAVGISQKKRIIVHKMASSSRH
jgi:hypothetical protein